MKETQQPGAPDRVGDLIQRARAGDQDAYTALYEATSQEVYRSVRAMVRDEELALDIQQDTYVSAFTHLEQLQEPEKFSAWLHTIAANLTRDTLRKRTPILFSELGDGEGDPLPELPEVRPEAYPELSLDRRETAELVNQILGELTEGQRAVIGMYYYEQTPVSRIAENLSVSPGTVKTQLSRGRKKIEAAVRRLKEEGVDLFGLSPLSFLLALLKRTEPSAQAERTVLTGALAKAGTVQPVVLHFGRRFFETLAGKLLLGLFAAGMVGGGVAGWYWYQNRAMGDYQLPAILEVQDSEEDLPTKPYLPTEPETTEDTQPPTEPVTEPDSPEDLTEPEDTQPEPTTPTPSESGTPGTPIAPELPAPSESLPAEDSEPSTSDTSGLEFTLPRVVDCYWGSIRGTYELFDQPWGSEIYIHIDTENGADPWLYTDNDSVVKLRNNGRYTGGNLQEGQTGYMWLASFTGSGTAHVYCVSDWGVTHVLTVTNPEYPETILECSIPFNDTDCFDLKLDLWERISIVVQGMTKPTVYTDRPDIVKADSLSGFSGSTFSGSQTNWIHKGYFLDVYPLQPGTAHVYIGLNGTVDKTYTVTVLDEYLYPPQTEPIEPPTEPATEPPTESTEEETEP